MNRMFLITSLVVMCCLVVLGCSGGAGLETAPVTGTVTMDGAPMANVAVTFVPVAGGAAASGQTDTSGVYTLNTVGESGAVLGKHTVKVTSMQATGSGTGASVGSDSPEYAKQASGDYAAGSAAASVKEVIPEKYNTKSELSYEVVAGKNTFDITMTSK